MFDLCSTNKFCLFPFISFLRRCSIGSTAKTPKCGTHVPKICPREYQFYFCCSSHGHLYDFKISPLLTLPCNKC